MQTLWQNVIIALCPKPMTTGYQRQLYSSSQANDNRSSAPALLFIPSQWHEVFSTTHAFLAPHLPFWCPICLFDTPSAFWCPICFLVPHLPFGAQSAFLVPHLSFLVPHMPFWHPACLLAPPFAFCKPHLPFGSPIFWKDPWQNVQQPKGALVFNSQAAICGWHHHHVQRPISSTNCFCNSCSIFPTCQDVPWSKSSFCLDT